MYIDKYFDRNNAISYLESLIESYRKGNKVQTTEESKEVLFRWVEESL